MKMRVADFEISPYALQNSFTTEWHPYRKINQIVSSQMPDGLDETQGEKIMRSGRIFFAILLTLLLVGLVAGVTWYAYNVGVAQGAATSAALTTPPAEGTVPPTPYYPPYGFYRPFGFWHPFGFGFLWCLFPFLFLLLLFGLGHLFFGPRRWGRGWGGPGMYGPGKWDPAQGDIPPGVKEWHQRLHEQDEETPPPSAQGA
jgi:hypothetical protein